MRSMILLALLCWSALAFAHKPSDSYLRIEARQSVIDIRWDIALRDLEYALGLDSDDDGAITWGELRTQAPAVAAYALARLALAADGAACPGAFVDMRVDEHTDGAYAVLGLRAECPLAPQVLDVEYRLFFDLDAQHRGLLSLAAGEGEQTAVFAPDQPRRAFTLGPGAGGTEGWRALPEFVREGVWHIWIGYDHILFLLSLLLPAVLARTGQRWVPAEDFRKAAWDTVRIVTAFTLAHSVTLSLAALGYVALPSRWVETAIAASVVCAALNNLLPVLHGRRALLAFGFGLVHGLGFAAVLADLGLPDALRVWGLLGFNLGVEAGQLAIVAGFLPLAFALRRFPVYEAAVLKLGSVGIMVVAVAWLVERGLDVRLWPA